MNRLPEYTGSCFCGAVRISARGDPAGMGYCHCDSCRHWSASPVNAFTLWPAASVSIDQGGDRIASYAKTPQSLRKWCTDCGGHLLTDHPAMGLVDVSAAMLPDLAFRPAVHVHYQEQVLRLPDGLPKFSDMPEAAGGSGNTLPQ